MASVPSKGTSRAASFLARLTSTILLWGIVAVVFWSGQLWALAILVAGGLVAYAVLAQLTGAGVHGETKRRSEERRVGNECRSRGAPSH